MRPPLLDRLQSSVRLFGRALTLCALTSLVAPTAAAAQTGEIAGTVTAAGTGEPLIGAQITVAGRTQRATSDDRGRFRITGLTGSTATLEVRRIGYRLERVTARVGDTNVGVTLSASPTSLEAVVVTGTAGATERRAIGNAVTTINAAEVTELAPVNNMQQLLNGRAAGVVIQQASGGVGTGSRIRVRGITSLSLSNEPLLYVDGVRVNNQAGTGPLNQSAQGSGTVSRINDINPEDIESIEILKGPAAATLYGTEASSGVINIITKKGGNGAARWTATARQGVNYLANWRQYFPDNFGRVTSGGPVVQLSMDSLTIANGGSIFRTGKHQELELGLAGGTDRVQYYASGGYLDSEGAEPTSWRRQYTGRLNLGVSPSNTFRVNSAIGFVTGPTHLSPEGGFGGRVWTTLQASPATYNTRQHGFHSAIPYQYDQLFQFWQDVDRFTASVRFEHQPASWLQHRFTAGADRTREGDNLFQPRIDSLQAQHGSAALGARSETERTVTVRTFDYAATATIGLGPGFRPTAAEGTDLRFATSVGGQFYHESTNFVSASGSIFPTPGVSSVNATTTNRSQSQDFLEDKTLGVYVQEQVSWKNRLFLTAALRSDDHSAFGANFNRVIYPKYSISWVASQEPWWMFGTSNTLRFRAAYGEAGRAPSTYASIRTYTPVTGPSESPAFTLQFLGNPDLGPERGKEVELGFDASALDDRINLELTYYNKKTLDAILDREIAPSVGYTGTPVPTPLASGVQPFNAGSIRNTGWEMLLRGTPYRSDRIAVDLTVNFSTNDNKILDLGMPGFTFVPVAGTLYMRHQQGYPVGSWFERKVVAAQLNPTTGAPIANTVMCDDGAGGQVLCAGADLIYGNGDDAPALFLGRGVAKNEGSFSSTVTLWNRLRLYGQVDFKTGFKKLDGNTRLRCWFFNRPCREVYFPLEYDPVRIAMVQSGQNLPEFFISDASFTKFREFAVSYQVPDRFARMANVDRASITLSGRNLKTWSDYPGEVETTYLYGPRGGHSTWDQTILPQLTQWVATLSLGF